MLFLLKLLNPDFVLDAKKLEIYQYENIGDYSLTFLRPEPPKMSIKPTTIREHLFSKYHSMPPPPLDNLEILSHNKSASNGSKKSSNKNFSSKLFYKFDFGRKINPKDIEEDDETSLEDESELEFQYNLERLLNRKYHSETELNKLDSDYVCQKNEEFNFIDRTNMIRTLSDSLLYNKQITNFDIDYQFIKISSNFNEAMEEVVFI